MSPFWWQINCAVEHELDKLCYVSSQNPLEEGEGNGGLAHGERGVTQPVGGSFTINTSI